MLYKVKKGYMFITLTWTSGDKSCMICESSMFKTNLSNIVDNDERTTKFLFFKEQSLIFYKGEFFTLKNEYHEFIERLL